MFAVRHAHDRRVVTIETEMPVAPEPGARHPLAGGYAAALPRPTCDQPARVTEWPAALVPGFEPLLHLSDLALLRSDDLGRQLDHLRLLGLRLGKLGCGDR